VLAVRPGPAFTAVTTDGEVRAVTIELTGTNAKARADRLFRATVDLRNA
jgi:VCBS repeat-containing protein